MVVLVEAHPLNDFGPKHWTCVVFIKEFERLLHALHLFLIARSRRLVDVAQFCEEVAPNECAHDEVGTQGSRHWTEADLR